MKWQEIFSILKISQLFILFIFIFSSPAMALPPEIEADRIIVSAAKHLGTDEAEKEFNEIKKLEIKWPAEYYYLYGKHLYRREKYKEANKNIEKYLVQAGREGEYYGESLELINIIEKKVKEIKARKKRLKRFIDHGDGTITDKKTGLMWAIKQFAWSRWNSANEYINNLKFAGYTDWRLPTLKELKSLYYDEEKENIISLIDLKEPGCWSVDTKPVKNTKSEKAGSFFFYDDGGKIRWKYKRGSNIYIYTLPVRDDSDYMKTAETLFKEAGIYRRAGKFSKALKKLYLAYEKGNMLAAYDIGKFFQKGYVKKDSLQAVKWFKIAKNGGIDLRKDELGFIYHTDANEYMKQKNYEQAVKLYKKAADEGYKKAQHELGLLYYHGHGVKTNNELAFKWLNKAAKKGYYRESTINLFEEKSEILKDPKLFYFLGLSYKNIDKAIDSFEEAANLGHEDSMVQLGIIYSFNIRSYDFQNDIKGLKWFLKAKENGVVSGIAFDIHDLKKGAEAASGNNMSSYFLALAYDNGIEVQQNKKKALQLYSKAANSGYSKAGYQLGLKYYHGRDVKQDYSKAFSLFQKAGENRYGHAKAQFYTGLCYATGRGTEKNIEKALKWYQKSHKQGYSKAQNAIAWIFATHPNQEIQDGERAVKYALKATQTLPDNWTYFDTLAAAYARKGDFEQAIQTERKVISMLQDDDSLSASQKKSYFQWCDQMISLYQSQTPYTEK